MLPAPLQPGDEIRIVSPSGKIDPAYIDGAKKVLSGWGYNATEGQFARSEYGRFGGTKEQRIDDLQKAFDDPNVKAVLCSRGGYGVAQIIDKIDFTSFCNRPKWLIGFSDITILHNAITQKGIASVHAIMAKHLTELDGNYEPVSRLKSLLEGNLPEYSIKSVADNRNGTATGKIIGGNLSVLAGMVGTAFDLPYEGNILFIEEIDERPYHIDRMMHNMRLSGALDKISGLVVGQFSDCDEDPQMMQSIREIILEAVKDANYPVCFDFPSGHVDYNLPLILGAESTLTVNSQTSELSIRK